VDLVNPIVQRVRREASENPDRFWDQAARDLHWFRTWDTVLDWQPPTFQWFVGGRTNLAYNCIDRHVEAGRGGQAALIYVNERGQRRVFTYVQLKREVERIAAGLRALGIDKGDRLTIYMPTTPEAIMLMLATVRIGAIHSVVFAGFGATALADRIVASGSKAVFTADITFRKGNNVPLKGIVDDAVKQAGDVVQKVVVLQRAESPAPPATDREITWTDFLAAGQGHDGGYVELEANEPAFILATSGTTARPKLAVHTHGGYQVHIHSMGKWVFGLRAGEVWWSTSDIGWVVGHSYIVYAPLLAGCATIAFEGAIDHRAPTSRCWSASSAPARS
jgi:acetyl-CoA synthetase